MSIAVATAMFAQSGQGAGPSPLVTFLPLLVMGFIFYFLVFRPQGRERRQREDMLKSVKKNDRIITVGGIIGTVTSVRDDEITIKVDESSNTKITFTRAAIQKIVTTSAAKDEDSAS